MTTKEIEEDIKKYPFVALLSECSRPNSFGRIIFDANRGYYYVDGLEVTKDEFWRQSRIRCSRSKEGN